jgi:hypothetical protein
VSLFILIWGCPAYALIADGMSAWGVVVGHGIGKVAVWVPVVVLATGRRIREDGLSFGRIKVSR